MAANPLPIPEEGALKHDVDARAKDIVGYCEDLFTEAKAGKEPFTRDWDVFFDMLIGKQWGPTPARTAPTVENRIFRIIQHMVALQTDTKPAVEVTARPQERDMEKLMRFGVTDQTLGDQAELLKKGVLSIWDDMDVDVAVLTGLLNGETFGRGLWKVVYNPFVNFRQGNVEVLPVDPRHFYIDPAVRYKESEANYMFFWSAPTIRELIDRHGAVAHAIKPDKRLSSFVAPATGARSMLARMGSIMRIPGALGQANRKQSRLDRAEQKECWVLDTTVNGTLKERNFFGRTIQPGEMLYPGGKRLITIAGDQLMQDRPSPFWDGEYPIVSWPAYIIPGVYWTHGEINALKPLQEMLNSILSALLSAAIEMRNPIWIGDADALSDEGWQKLPNAAGAKVRKAPGRELRRDPPPAMPAYYFQLINHLEQTMDVISGLMDLTGSQRRSGVVAGVAVEALQFAAQTTVRQKARLQETALRRMGQLMISRIFQYWTTDRHISTWGEEGKWITERFTRKVLVPDGIDPMEHFQRFQFTVAPFSTLAINKMQKAILATQLLEIGAIDREELLRVLEYPNAFKIIDRLKQEQALGLEPTPGGRVILPRGSGGKKRGS